MFNSILCKIKIEKHIINCYMKFKKIIKIKSTYFKIELDRSSNLTK